MKSNRKTLSKKNDDFIEIEAKKEADNQQPESKQDKQDKMFRKCLKLIEIWCDELKLQGKIADQS